MISVEEACRLFASNLWIVSTFSTLFSCFCGMEAGGGRCHRSPKARADFKALVGFLLQIGLVVSRGFVLYGLSRCRTAAGSPVSGVGYFGGSVHRRFLHFLHFFVELQVHCGRLVRHRRIRQLPFAEN